MEYFESAVVGITGGIGTGKSTVAQIIAEMGYPMISTDAIAKEIMLSDKKVISEIKSAFGNEAYNEDSTPNTKFISDAVFGSSADADARLLVLNSIVHPPVIERLSDIVAALEDEGKEIIFVESALIFESGIEEDFDFIITVDAPEDAVVARVSGRSGLTREQVLARISGQMPNKEKIAVSDFVIDNKGTIDELRTSTEMIVEVVKSLAGLD